VYWLCAVTTVHSVATHVDDAVQHVNTSIVLLFCAEAVLYVSLQLAEFLHFVRCPLLFLRASNRARAGILHRTRHEEHLLNYAPQPSLCYNHTCTKSGSDRRAETALAVIVGAAHVAVAAALRAASAAASATMAPSVIAAAAPLAAATLRVGGPRGGGGVGSVTAPLQFAPTS